VRVKYLIRGVRQVSVNIRWHVYLYSRQRRRHNLGTLRAWFYACAPPTRRGLGYRDAQLFCSLTSTF
jgi:hypothetical protein